MSIKTEITLIKSMLYFLASVRNGKLNITAEKNGIKTSNLSKLIKELETTLGYKLLTRKNHGVEATPEGLVFLSLAEELEDAINKLKNIQTQNLAEVLLYVSENISIDLSKIKTDAKIVQTHDISNFDIGILDECECRFTDYKIVPINIKRGILKMHFFVAYKDNPAYEDFCHKLLEQIK